MTPREEGFLLLTSHLGNPDRKVLTVAQLRVLAVAVRASKVTDTDREMTDGDLMALGFNRPSAQRIIDLLSDREQLKWYLKQGKRMGCSPVTRVTPAYPVILRQRLGLDSPGCLWAKGDVGLLARPAVSLVGSRELHPKNEAFAQEVGRQAALQGFVLVSGNARGADRTAQDSCLAHGGQVISVVADALQHHSIQENVLYLSEDAFDLEFSAQRALSRNRVIHSLGLITLVAQCKAERGGTWHGTRHNLQKQLSPVFCFDDGSQATALLEGMGAHRIGTGQLEDLQALKDQYKSLFDQ